MVLGACLTSAACNEPTQWVLEGRGFVPPAKYRVLWRTTELCSGVRGDFDAVEWFVTSGSADGDEPDVRGSWYPDGNRIWLHENAVDDDQLVRHEMLHALLRQGHVNAFVGACGGLVLCTTTCIAEAGGLPAGPSNEAATIHPEDLTVTMDVIGPLPGDTGWMAVVMTATNPNPVPVWVDLSGRPGVQFACRLGDTTCSPGFGYTDAKDGFGALQARRKAMTFRVDPGDHVVWGAYNSVERGPVSVTRP